MALVTSVSMAFSFCLHPCLLFQHSKFSSSSITEKWQQKPWQSKWVGFSIIQYLCTVFLSAVSKVKEEQVLQLSTATSQTSLRRLHKHCYHLTGPLHFQHFCVTIWVGILVLLRVSTDLSCRKNGPLRLFSKIVTRQSWCFTGKIDRQCVSINQRLGNGNTVITGMNHLLFNWWYGLINTFHYHVNYFMSKVESWI